MKTYGYYMDMSISLKIENYPYFSDITINDLACVLMVFDNFDIIKSVLNSFNRKDSLK